MLFIHAPELAHILNLYKNVYIMWDRAEGVLRDREPAGTNKPLGKETCKSNIVWSAGYMETAT